AITPEVRGNHIRAWRRSGWCRAERILCWLNVRWRSGSGHLHGGKEAAMVRFGVLGAGRIGKVHAGTVARSGRASVAYVADALPDAAQSMAEAIGAKVVPVDEVIAASDVDAILICTPTDTHADLIEKAALSGKPILCEKPVSLSVERIEACLPVVEKAGVPLMIGFNRRFDPNFGALKQRLDAGEVGAVELV